MDSLGKRVNGWKRALAASVGTLAILGIAGCSPARQAADVGHDPVKTARASIAGGVYAEDQEVLTPEQKKGLGPVAKSSVAHAENRDLDSGQIKARLEAIDARYQVGQAFDPVDAEFIRAYAIPNQDVLTSSTTAELAGTQGFSVSGGSGTHACKIGGTVGHYGGPINYSWKASTAFTRGSGVKKATLHAYPRGYGVVGSNGIGLVYSSSPGLTTTSSSYQFNRSGSYSALEVYFTIYVDATCSYSTGSYTLKSPLAWE